MTKRRINRIISLMMAMLMLVSSTGFSIDAHYCQGQMKSFSLFGKAKSCHEQSFKKQCSSHKKSCHAALSNSKELGKCKKGCCSNKTIHVEGNDEAKKIPTTEILPMQVQFFTAFVQVFILEYTQLNKAIIPYLNYIPPLLNQDIPVLIQSFLL